MLSRFQDAMAVIREKGKPSLFITMTCNPNWKEIQEQLLEGQKEKDRPDLEARVFKMKFDELMDDLVKKGWFGKVSAYMAVIEYQKRGLPHSHILLILDNDDKIKAIEDVDDFISAEIPPHPASITYPNDRLKEDRIAQDERLRKLVLTHMVHGPCGNEKPNSPCMFNSNGEATNICH